MGRWCRGVFAVGLMTGCVGLFFMHNLPEHAFLARQLRVFTSDHQQEETMTGAHAEYNARCINQSVTIPSVLVDKIEVHTTIGQNHAHTRIIYNRVAKCGSTTVWEALKQLAMKNNVSFLHSLNYSKARLEPDQEAALVHDLQGRSAPWIYDRHIQMLDFTKFGFQMPHYINVYREPAERRRSHYYFMNYLYRAKNMTFDECVTKKLPSCSQSMNCLSFFCGHQENCSVADKRTLEIAKQNVVKYYDVVGLTEDLEAFFQLLEIHFPLVFEGVLEIYRETSPQNVDTKSHQMLNSTREYLKQILWLEYEFYEFVKHRFHDAKKKAGL